jgi:hypothetical protein
MHSNIGPSWPWVARLACCCLAGVSSAELLFGVNSFVSCPTYFSTPYRDPDGTVVHAQYLQDNRYLCNENFDAFRYRHGSTANETDQDVASYLGVVAKSGNCSLQQKAAMLELFAEQDSVAVRFLVLIDDESTTGTPGVMESGNYSNGSSSLTILSVSQECGYSLMGYLAEQANTTQAHGGAPLFLLSDDPQYKSEDAESALRSTLQLVALVVFSFAGSFLLAHVAFSYCRPTRARRRRRRGGGQEDQVQRCLLSEACVEQFQSEEATLKFFAQFKNALNSASHSNTGNRSIDDVEPGGTDEDPQQPTCAVCLEILTVHSKVAVLPCDHGFHFECIAPWLTRRQACCPLCKLVLHDPTRADPCVEESAISAGSSFRTAEEGGGALGGASIGDENSITTTTLDLPDSAASDPLHPVQRHRWWNRLWLSSSARGSPREANVVASTDLTLDLGDHEPGSNLEVSSGSLQSSATAATSAADDIPAPQTERNSSS